MAAMLDSGSPSAYRERTGRMKRSGADGWQRFVQSSIRLKRDEWATMAEKDTLPSIDEIIDMCRVPAGKRVRLKDFDAGWAGDKDMPKAERKAIAEKHLTEDTAALAQAQDLLYADDTWAVLVILQAMDAAGKDSTIKHVMSGVNPQGCQVFSFKHPSAEELDHNFLWRYARAAPERGRIGIFNRSYYEDVLVVRVHPELVQA